MFQHNVVQAYVKDLTHSVQVAALNFDVWWVLKSDVSRPKYVKGMRRYNQFFQTSIHAHFVALLMALYGLYETRADTFNIPGLLKHLRKDTSIPQAKLASFESSYSNAKPLWLKVSILRNEVFGHRSMASDDAFEKASVTPFELRDLVVLTKELLNDVAEQVLDSTHAFNLSATEDTVNLLEKINTPPRRGSD